MDINNLQAGKYILAEGLVCWNSDMQLDSGMDVTQKDINDLGNEIFPGNKIRTVT